MTRGPSRSGRCRLISGITATEPPTWLSMEPTAAQVIQWLAGVAR